MKTPDHAPLITPGWVRIVGCLCGWRTPPNAADSDDAFALHVASVDLSPEFNGSVKEAPHEKMKRDEVEYAECAARAYAICCSQRALDDETELQGAFWAGFKSACAYLRAPGICRAAIVVEPASATSRDD